MSWGWKVTPRLRLFAVRLESSFGYELFVRFEFSSELAFGNGEIDYKTESVRDLPSR